MERILWLFLGDGLLLFLIALPMYFGKIPPNGLYGFRVRKTMENPELWYPVNKYSSRWLMATGLLTALSALLLYFVPALEIDIYAISCAVVFVIIFSVGMVLTFRYMNSL